MRRLKHVVAALALAIALLGPGVLASQASAASAPPSSPTPQVDGCKKKFLGLKPWYYYLNAELTNSKINYGKRYKPEACDIKCFNVFNQTTANECGKKDSDIPGVLLVIVDDLLRIAALVALAYIFVSAFQYVVSQGKPEETAKAQSSIVNALIGLGVAIVSVAFVSFIGARLG